MTTRRKVKRTPDAGDTWQVRCRDVMLIYKVENVSDDIISGERLKRFLGSERILERAPFAMSGSTWEESVFFADSKKTAPN